MQRNSADTNKKETNAVEENEPKTNLDNNEETEISSVGENEPESDVEYNSQDEYAETDLEEELNIKDYSLAEIREMYKDYFPPDVIEDFCTLKKLLNAEVINRNLAELEKILVVTLAQQTSPPFFKSTPSAQDILAQVMQTWARNNGFTTSDKFRFYAAYDGENGIKKREMLELPPSTMRLYNVVPQYVFKAFILKYKNLFDDEGISIAHGRFSHFLQWFVVTEENKAKRILNNSPADLMRIMGEISSAKIIPWDIIFDRGVENYTYHNPNFFLASTDGRRQYDYPEATIEDLNADLFLNLRTLLLQIAADRDPNYVSSTEEFYPKDDYEDIIKRYRATEQLKIDDCIMLDDKINQTIYFDDITVQVKYMRKHLEVHRELASNRDEYLPYNPGKSLLQNLNQQMYFLVKQFNLETIENADTLLLSLQPIFNPGNSNQADNKLVFAKLLNELDSKLDFDKLSKELAKFMYAFADIAITLIEDKHNELYQVQQFQQTKRQKR